MTSAAIVALLLAYAVGAGSVWRRAGVGRGVLGGHALRFGAGWVALSAALASPLEAAAGRSLAAHMAQHLLVVAVAAPLFATAGVGLALAHALPRRARLALAPAAARVLAPARRPGGSPLPAAAAYAGVVWAWHAPFAYQAALASAPVHAAEHLSLLAVAWAFWATVLPAPGRARRGPGAVAALLGASFALGALGAFMTLAPVPWYRAYAAAAAASGGDAMADQRLAGLLMWMPTGSVHAGAALVVAAGWLRARPARAAAGREPAGGGAALAAGEAGA